MIQLRFALRYRKSRLLYSSSHGFCHFVDSPELPDWFRYPENEQPCPDSDDNFVLPTKLEFLEGGRSGSSRACSYRADARVASHGAVDSEVHVDEISSILKSNFPSPEAAAKVLDGCSVRVSKSLVDRILRRFFNDWIPAFGFFIWAGAQVGYAHSSDTYDTIVDILGKSKRFDLMWGLMEEMVRIGGLVSLATMTKVMRRLSSAGRWKDAIKAFHDMDHFGVKKDTAAMNALLDTLCKERSVMRARDVFLELRYEIPPDASSFNSLIHGWCRARKLEEAQQTVKEMREFGLIPCVITYTSLIEAYCMEKNFGMVNAILEEMRAKGCLPNVITYTIIMHALGKAKETQEAFDIVDTMKKDGCAPDNSFYNSLIYILARAGRLRDANMIFEEMRKDGLSPDVTTYNTLISASCDHSLEGDALKLLVKMEGSSCKPDIKTYTPLLKVCCKRQWVKMLLFLLVHMFKKDISPDFSTYTLLVKGLCQNGKVEQSCLFFEEMVLKGFIPRQHTYNMLVKALQRKCMDGTKKKVEQLMMRAQSL